MTKLMVGFIALYILSFTPSARCQNQWTQTSGPGSEKINALIVTDSSLFAGTNDGAYISKNNGLTWDKASLYYASIYSFLKNGDTIFTGAAYGRVYKSTNNGVSWKSISVDTGMSSSEVHALAMCGNSLFAGISSTKSGIGGIYSSTNNGESWFKVLPISVNVHAFAVKGDTVFAGTDNGVLVSKNRGVSWGLTTTLINQKVKSLAVSGNSILAGMYQTSDDGIFLSMNNGESWTAVNTGLTNCAVSSFAVVNDTVYAGTSGKGILISTNNGASWTALCTNQTCLCVNVFAVKGNTIFAGTEFDGLIFSADGGFSWTTVSMGMTHANVSALVVNSNTLYAGTSYGFMYSSINNGASWSTVNAGLQNSVNALAVDGSGIFTAVGKSICHSADNGLSWDTVISIDEVAYALTVNDSNIFVGTYDGLMHTTDKGKSWAKNNLKADKVYALVMDRNTVFAGTGDSGVYVSTDNGDSWTAVNAGLISEWVTALAISGNKVFAGIFGKGVFFSNDKGTSWNPINSGLTNMYIDALAVQGDTVFAGTSGDGVWCRSISQITAVIPPKQQNASLTPKLRIHARSLLHGDVTISYCIQSRCAVEVSLYNVSGQRAVLLAYGEKKPGAYYLEIRNGSVPPGLYVCRFIAGSNQEHIRIIIAR